jgi:hypothetical protein
MADGLIGRAAKKLEQALGVPRPWELGLATSVGYQMAAGEGSLGERARKGGAQFLGRYATNMVDPAMELNLPRLNQISPRAIIKDQAPWLTTAGSDTIGNEVFAREMFDLPPRFPVEAAEQAGFVKTGPKQYTLEGRRAPEGYGEGLHYNSLLGRYNVTKNPKTQELEYKDVWDISSPVGSTPVVNLDGVGAGDYQQEGSLLSYMIREMVNPYLRPVTVSGKTKVE